jgi:hypothetical protein
MGINYLSDGTNDMAPLPVQARTRRAWAVCTLTPRQARLIRETPTR